MDMDDFKEFMGFVGSKLNASQTLFTRREAQISLLKTAPLSARFLQHGVLLLGRPLANGPDRLNQTGMEWYLPEHAMTVFSKLCSVLPSL